MGDGASRGGVTGTFGAKPKNGNGRGRICRRHWPHKASRFSGGITLTMQPLRTGKPCEAKHDTIFIPFHFRF
jgi:hypothetical protein